MFVCARVSSKISRTWYFPISFQSPAKATSENPAAGGGVGQTAADARAPPSPQTNAIDKITKIIIFEK
jgi:hypothetical protein